MPAPTSREWLDRGRGHLLAARPVDAIACLARAAAAEPAAAAPRFHLGEALWHLDRRSDAIAAWRAAVAAEPAHLASRQALAEGLLAQGRAAEAIAAAEAVLALAPGDPRARAVRAIAELGADATGVAANGPASRAAVAGDGRAAVAGDERAAAVASELVAALVAAPQLVHDTTLTGALARALEGDAAAAVRAPVLAALAAMPDALALLPALALAQLAEWAAAAAPATARTVVAAARARVGALVDGEPLRRLAVVARTVDADAARELARAFARRCRTDAASGVPLCWPRRTAGDALRVVVLAGAADHASLRALAAALPPGASLVPAFVGGDDPAAAGALVLPAVPGPAAAAALAALDPDVLVDAVGIKAAIGPLLACRPARAVWTLAGTPPPLADAAFADVDALRTALAAAAAELRGGAACALDGAAMTAAWHEAIRGQQRAGADAAAGRRAVERVLALQPGFAPALLLQAMLRRREGDPVAASAAFAELVAVAPDAAEARSAASEAALAAGDAEAAATLAREGTLRDPGNATFWRALGLAELARGDGAAAAAAFERALGLAPADAETRYNLGVARQQAREFDGALHAYHQALTLAPGYVAADYNMAVILREQGRVDAAIAALERVLQVDPRHVPAYKALGEVLLEAGHHDRWLASFRRFEANCPRALPLAVQALEALQYAGAFDELDAYLDGLRGERFVAADAAERVDALEQLLFLLLYFDVEPALVHRYALAYDAAAPLAYGRPLPPPPVRRPGRLRIGYLSGDLRDHVMGKQMWAAVEHHDRARFALHFYSLSTREDDWTARFRGIADRYAVLAHASERDAALAIAADDLDVLVDLSTHTKGSRPGILAFKPARVQITHVASCGTVGLSTIDYKLTDRYADLPASAATQIEAPLPMDGCVYPYRKVIPAAQHGFRREALGVAADAVLIGAFVNPQKLSRRCLALWRDVLARIPRARLVFSPAAPALNAPYLRLAEAAGIARDRVLFLTRPADEASQLARYALIDFVLDPMPYGSVNGVIEPLEMGVPVVTLLGRRHGERAAYSILANLGVTATVAQDERAYVDIAVRLADDPAHMAAVRAAIRAGIAASPLTDMPAHTRALERAYVAALAAKAPAALAAAEPGAPA